MTLDGGGGEMAPTTEGYENWMNYSLSKNPNTIFMIGAPWQDFPSDHDTATYTSAWREAYPSLDGIFASLRAKYPGVTIIDNPYSLAAVEARLLYEAGGVPDVTSLFGGCDEDISGESLCGDALFNDYKGHAGEFLQNLAALIWLNRIYSVDLSTYSSSALSQQFTTDMPAAAKAILDAFDAGNFCGQTMCSTCNVTTPCGVPPVIKPLGCRGECHVYVTLTIARNISDMSTAILENICGTIARAAGLAANAATCTVREGAVVDDAGSVVVEAALDIQDSGQTVQNVMNTLSRTFTNNALPGWVLNITVDTVDPPAPAGMVYQSKVTFAAVVAGTVADFDQMAFKNNMASLLGGVDPADISLTVTAASVRVVSVFTTTNQATAATAAKTIATYDSTAISVALKVTVETVEAPTVAVEAVTAPPPSPSPPPLEEEATTSGGGGRAQPSFLLAPFMLGLAGLLALA